MLLPNPSDALATHWMGAKRLTAPESESLLLLAMHKERVSGIESSIELIRLAPGESVTVEPKREHNGALYDQPFWHVERAPNPRPIADAEDAKLAERIQKKLRSLE